MARDEGVYGWAEPTQRSQACDPAEPNQLRQNTQQGQPSFKSTQPLSFRGAHVHFPVEVGAREGSLRRHRRVVIIQESHALTGIIRLNFRLRPSAEGAGTVQENV